MLMELRKEKLQTTFTDFDFDNYLILDNLLQPIHR